MELAELREAVEKAIADYHRENGLDAQCTTDTFIMFDVTFDPEIDWPLELRRGLVVGAIDNAHYWHRVSFQNTGDLAKIVNDLFSGETVSSQQRTVGECDGLLEEV